MIDDNNIYNGTDNIYPDTPFALKNNSARLISVRQQNDETGETETFMVLPGNNKPTPIPSCLTKLDFVTANLANDNLTLIKNA